MSDSKVPLPNLEMEQAAPPSPADVVPVAPGADNPGSES